MSSVYGESEENILEFNYTGSAHAVTLNPGKYVLECWGAQGGGLQNNSSLDTAAGGMGGYSVGTLTLTSRTTIYVYVGGMGKSIGSGLAEGGFNGGGAAYGSSEGEPANGGGGATDIRIGTDSLYARVIVAGGGGGGGLRVVAACSGAGRSASLYRCGGTGAVLCPVGHQPGKPGQL